ncbi:hypothetical protein KW798_03405 [Candidatus Parcubacteria bacterium]|nr:hypothetical protein [Candidatus Parcubacteria bacterium]
MRIPPDSQSHVFMEAWVKCHGNANVPIHMVEKVLQKWCEREHTAYHLGLRTILWRSLIENYSDSEEGDSIKVDAKKVGVYFPTRKTLAKNNHRLFQLAEVQLMS